MAGLSVDMAALSLLSLPSNLPYASHRSWVSPPASPPLPRSSLTLATSFAVSASGGQRCDGKTVVVTRERGKNDRLMAVLGGHGISCLELPLIEHEEGPDLARLHETIRDCLFDWIVLTSPEAASIFVDAWKIAGFPNVQLAVVGSGTAQVLENAKVDGAQIDIGFMPSKANAKVLSEELPRAGKVDGKVLFPASLKASNELERVLSERGFDVVRLNTYTTVLAFFF